MGCMVRPSNLRRAEIFYLPKNVDTSSRVHPVFYPVGKGVIFPVRAAAVPLVSLLLTTRRTRTYVIQSCNSSSSSIGTTARCVLWPVEHRPSIFSYLPPTLSIFSFPALEDLYLLPLSILSWAFPSASSLPVPE